MNHPNVVGTPQIAFNSHEALERINRCTVENITAYLAGTARNLVTTGDGTSKRPVPKKKRAGRG